MSNLQNYIDNLGSVVLPLPIIQHIEYIGYGEGTTKLIKLCSLLKDEDGLFQLSGTTAAKVINNTDWRAGFSHLNALVADELLEVVEKGVMYQKGIKGKATTYRWLADEEGNF